MGKYVARQAIEENSDCFFQFNFPFHYSRLYEYTNNPLIWYQIGGIEKDSKSILLGENHSLLSEKKLPFLVVYYHATDVVVACTICGSTADLQFLNSVRKIVESGRIKLDELKTEFESYCG